MGRTSRTGRINPRERELDRRLGGGGLVTGLNALVKRELLPVPGIEPRFLSPAIGIVTILTELSLSNEWASLWRLGPTGSTCNADHRHEMSSPTVGSNLARGMDVCVYYPTVRPLVTGFPPRRPGLEPRSSHVGFVVDKVALRADFL
jgi:hypothetical protein